MAFDKAHYDKEYNKLYIKRKFIPFNITNRDDAELLKWLDCKGNVTQYVKDLIRADMKAKRQTIRCQIGCQIETADAEAPEE